jgi:hypothetical protein
MVNGEEMFQNPPADTNATVTESRGHLWPPQPSPPRARQRSDSIEDFDRWCESMAAPLRHANHRPTPQPDQTFNPFDFEPRGPNRGQAAAAAEQRRYPSPPPRYEATRRSHPHNDALPNREQIAAAAEARLARRNSLRETGRNTGNVQRQTNTQPNVRRHPIFCHRHNLS